MADDTFVAYFILNGRSAGQAPVRMPDAGWYPESIEWEGNVYMLFDGAPADREAYYRADA